MKDIKKLSIGKIAYLLECVQLDGFITGMDRSKDDSHKLNKVAHIYRGSFYEPGDGMCKRSMGKDGYYSIWRNNVGDKGICKICLRNVHKELK
jgi:hypothetical protein